jgi:hypothetical protein
MWDFGGRSGTGSWIFLVTVIPLMLHKTFFVYHRRYIILTIDRGVKVFVFQNTNHYSQTTSHQLLLSSSVYNRRKSNYITENRITKYSFNQQFYQQLSYHPVHHVIIQPSNRITMNSIAKYSSYQPASQAAIKLIVHHSFEVF